MANNIPTAAKVSNTVISSTLKVLTVFIGVPSGGIPPADNIISH